MMFWNRKPILSLRPARILLRATNWVGDAIMTLPAVRTIRQNFPEARITVLAQPWVADVFTSNPFVDDVILYEKKTDHRGIAGMWRLGRQLAGHGFDMAILLQNAFEAALLARLAGIPVIAGYSRDGRWPLLTHPVRIRPAIRQTHQVHYYQDLLRQLGLAPGPDELYLFLPEEATAWSRRTMEGHAKPLVGLNPGAAYGPAKRWPADKYAGLAHRLWRETGATPVVFGTDADRDAAARVREKVPAALDLTGRTTLAQAMAAISRCDVFVTNDSGLMHVAAAAGIPLVAIFGSTDAVATGPFSENARIVRREMECSPCLQPECSKGFHCMLDISEQEVGDVVLDLLAGH